MPDIDHIKQKKRYQCLWSIVSLLNPILGNVGAATRRGNGALVPATVQLVQVEDASPGRFGAFGWPASTSHVPPVIFSVSFASDSIAAVHADSTYQDGKCSLWGA